MPDDYEVPEGDVLKGTDIEPCEPVSGAGTEANPFIFQVKLNYFVSSTGYFSFTNCKGSQRPTIKIRANSTYKFVQTEKTNWLHPLGFAYGPDGAHDGRDELEPGVKPPGSKSKCDESKTCQSPRYHGGKSGDVFLGRTGLLSTPEDPYAGMGDGEFGLETYESHFQDHSLSLWARNKYSVLLRIEDEATAEIYYFCHVHRARWMSGKIIVVNPDGTPRKNQQDVVLYSPTVLSRDDEVCGTPPAPEYGDNDGPAKFIGKCETKALCGPATTFKRCMEGVDCHMNYNMRVTHTDDPISTFMRQMIPHHQNAVNMAKVVLKLDKEHVRDVDKQLGGDAFVENLLLDIINTQNMQIMMMHSYLVWKTKQGEPEVYDQECAEKLQDKNLIVWAFACVGLCIGGILSTASWYVFWRRQRHGQGKDKYSLVQATASVSAVAPASQVQVSCQGEATSEEVDIALA
ncbi:hypothetical protein GUITHDRAFT_112878 [Guillardia theta CCMP2712]|uniref:Uncharacterized protein n=1 Tax=Guillardia theta (strain CCMP2712) TaxID=905079 RepID=L1IYF2_GUITC|nr:hypothetical protein GUITHDRAFT_112878 [Guillardia theta CCMP2712]EKX41142.1 hypothetical protein GUITHDRAFT_112878 [Guillardia theta CCMP2712]|eukprot:XP_005828122.1 hypothetical protein GUITHDRAFT_112878 [Guillardia theta CCMP2712]